MKKLFEEISINNLRLKNRFVRSATSEGMADSDGNCKALMFNLVSDLAKGGAGLIITGHMFVGLSGRMLPYQSGVHCDDMLPGLSKLANAAHKNGAKIILQLNHSGCYSMKDQEGNLPAGPSASSVDADVIPNCREMKITEISKTVKDFSVAAGRAKNAGFDGVQLHAAHNSLLSQFLSPTYNGRNDAYGGDAPKRHRIIVEAYEAVRSAVGQDFPVLIKLNSDEFIDGGFSIKDMLRLSAILQDKGIDAIEMSGGTRHPLGKQRVARLGDSNRTESEAYYKSSAKLFKEKLNIPLILVGGIRSFETASLLLKEGLTDLISFSRPLVREPDLINRWQRGFLQRSTCVSCNRCYDESHSGRGLSCALDKNGN